MPGRGHDPNILVGTETADDAGVYRLSDDLALVQTLDFFPPLVDDPYTYGQIAAANSLSDVYAMNGRPLTALNIAAFPDNELPISILGEIVRGAAERVTAAGAVTLGGHTVRDAEVKFGLSVTGLVHPRELLTNAGARVGDVLVLTKALGTGFVTTAFKRDHCPSETLSAAVASMIQLNVIGRDAARTAGGAHAMTDVTGFGLAGHASEMADGACVTCVLDLRALPILPGAAALATPDNYNRARAANRAFLEGRIAIEPGVDELALEFAFDAQTSGGLLIAVDPDRADALVEAARNLGAHAVAIVGHVVKCDGPISIILR